MRRMLVLALPLVLAARVVAADEGPAADRGAQAQKTPPQTAKDPGKQDPKLLEGMSILGNQEAPKALVIVPWKSSELGDALGIVPLLDDSKAPVDRDVFLRSLSYYEIRSETTRHDGVNRSKS